MKRSIINYFDMLQERLTAYVAMLNFRYMNLCVKAEEASLIPIQVPVEGAVKKLEDVCTIGKKGEYSFALIPNYDDEMDNIAKSVALTHPEFKQKKESMNVSGVDENGKNVQGDVGYLLLTMPEVNDDRYDALKNGVDFFYKDVKVKMEAAIVESTAKLTSLLVGEPEKDVDSVKDGLEKLKKEYTEKRDKLRDDKLQEIEDAHNKWLSENSQIAEREQEIAAARGENAGSTLRLNEEYE